MNGKHCIYLMNRILIPSLLVVAASSALAANANAPVVIDANATAAYINDGSSTNRMSPPVPGVRPLRSLTVKPQYGGGVANTITPATEATPAITANRTRTATATTVTQSKKATFRAIDKRPIELNPVPVKDGGLYSLDDVPKSEQRKPPAVTGTSTPDLLVPLSPAR